MRQPRSLLGVAGQPRDRGAKRRAPAGTAGPTSRSGSAPPGPRRGLRRPAGRRPVPRAAPARTCRSPSRTAAGRRSRRSWRASRRRASRGPWRRRRGGRAASPLRARRRPAAGAGAGRARGRRGTRRPAGRRLSRSSAARRTGRGCRRRAAEAPRLASRPVEALDVDETVVARAPLGCIPVWVAAAPSSSPPRPSMSQRGSATSRNARPLRCGASRAAAARSPTRGGTEVRWTRGEWS